MTFDGAIKSVVDDIQRQTKKLSLLYQMKDIFAVFKFDGYLYFAELSDGEVFCEFGPGFGEEVSKDLRPLVHAMARKFHVKFSKELNHDGTSIMYQTHVEINGKKLDLNIRGVVPATCHYEETVVELTDAELEEAHAKIKPTRVVRKLVCK